MHLFLWVIFVFFARSAGTCHMLLGCSLGGLSALFLMDYLRLFSRLAGTCDLPYFGVARWDFSNASTSSHNI